MVTTRDQTLQNAQRIIRDVFNTGANSALEKAFTENDLLDVHDWMHLSVEDLKSVTYDDNGTKLTYPWDNGLRFDNSRCTFTMNVLMDSLRPIMVVMLPLSSLILFAVQMSVFV